MSLGMYRGINDKDWRRSYTLVPVFVWPNKFLPNWFDAGILHAQEIFQNVDWSCLTNSLRDNRISQCIICQNSCGPLVTSFILQVFPFWRKYLLVMFYETDFERHSTYEPGPIRFLLLILTSKH